MDEEEPERETAPREPRESPGRRGSPERRNPLRMAARTASLAAEGVVEAVAAEVSVRKVASGKVRRAALRPKRATMAMPPTPKAKPTRSRTAMDVPSPTPLCTRNGSSGRRARANQPTPYR